MNMTTMYDRNLTLPRFAARHLERVPVTTKTSHANIYARLQDFCVEKNIPVPSSIALGNYLRGFQGFYDFAGSGNRKMWCGVGLREIPVAKIEFDDLAPWT